MASGFLRVLILTAESKINKNSSNVVEEIYALLMSKKRFIVVEFSSYYVEKISVTKGEINQPRVDIIQRLLNRTNRLHLETSAGREGLNFIG